MQNTVMTWNSYIIEFCEIVIPSCQPEHGNAVEAGGGRLISKFDRTQSFENRKQRAAEESHLLARNNRRCARAQSGDIFQRFGRSTPFFILRFKNRGHPFADCGVITDSSCLILQPLGKIWGSWKELMDRGCPGEEIGEQARNMWNLAERQTLRLHWRLPIQHWTMEDIRWSTYMKPNLTRHRCDDQVSGGMQRVMLLKTAQRRRLLPGATMGEDSGYYL